MAVTLSQVVPAARSVSFFANVSGEGETVTMNEIAAAYLAAGGSSSSAIYAFLTQTINDSAEQVGAAFSDAGATVSVIGINSTGSVAVSEDPFKLSLSGAEYYSVRIALAASISA